MGKTVFIVNPQAGGGRAREAFMAVEMEVVQQFDSADVYWTVSPGHATELTRQVLLLGYDRIIAVGGDGTLNEVVNGMLDENGKMLNEDAAMGFLPCGIENDLRWELGWPRDLRGSMHKLQQAVPRYIDVAQVSAVVDGETKKRFFLTSIGIGPSVDTIAFVAAHHWGIGLLTYLIAWANTNAFKGPYHMKIDIEGYEPIEIERATIVAQNGRYGSGGMHLMPDAKLDDGLIDIIVAKDQNLRFMAKHWRELYTKASIQDPLIVRYQSRQFSVSSLGKNIAGLHVDGELFGQTPVKINVVPKALRMLI